MTTVATQFAPAWVTQTLQIEDIPNLLMLLPDHGGFAWVSGEPEQHIGVVGWGSVDHFTISGTESFSQAQRWWDNWCKSAAGDSPLAFASFAFSPSQESTLTIPEVLIRRTETGTTLTVTALAQTIERTVVATINHLRNFTPSPSGVPLITWTEGTRTVEEWATCVDEAIIRINRGEVDKVVLARDTFANSDSPIHIGALLSRLNLAFPECWTFCVDGLIGATPELLVRRDGHEVTSRVLAGTIRRSSNSDRDGQLAAALLGSDKDQEEHAYAVESVAAALAQHCVDLHVPADPFVLQLANVQHLATDVTGELAQSTPVLTLAASLHPTAAVCGTPTERAKSLIKELEGMERGRYAGPVGWIDAHGNGEIGIALRCAEINNERTTLRLFAGCGIVAGSTSAAEVAESQSKFAAMRDALV